MGIGLFSLFNNSVFHHEKLASNTSLEWQASSQFIELRSKHAGFEVAFSEERGYSYLPVSRYHPQC